MKIFLYTLIALVGIAAISFSIPSKNEGDWKAPDTVNKMINPLKGNTKATLKGKKIFEVMCWTCHGLQGKGDGPASEGLELKPANHTTDLIQKQTDGALFWKISNGRGTMIGYETVLSDNQRWQLVNYIRELGKK